MRLTVKDVIDKKKRGEKIVSLTAYDFSMAEILDEAGVDILLVGDSVGMVCLGYDSTLPVTMREMLHHTKAVRRAVKRGLVVADMPFASFQQSPEKALRNAARFMKEGGADAVKLEGGREVLEVVRVMRKAGVPVMGHLGLTPQRVGEFGGYKVQGQAPEEARRIEEEARLLEEAGVFALVLECVPWELARSVTEALSVPTIGIGAGPYCDGQVLVLYDLLGLQSRVRPRFVRVYAPLGDEMRKAVRTFCEDVSAGRYPTLEESFGARSAKKVKTKD
jgi:3-methyl-2-oxobutanoate hydroxymethyltransferase